MKERHILILDTETVNITHRFIYNIAWLVFDTEKMLIVEQKNYLINQIYNDKRTMKKAFFKDKMPIYKKKLKQKKIKKVYFGNALRYLKNTLERYNLKSIYAYNCSFDKSSIDKTCKKLGIGNQVKDIEFIDIIKSIKAFTDDKDYKKFCEKNNLLTKTKKVSKTAENVFRFIINDIHFQEQHTALSDCKIELLILLYGKLFERVLRLSQKQPYL